MKLKKTNKHKRNGKPYRRVVTKKNIQYGGAKAIAERLFKEKFEIIKDTLLSDSELTKYLDTVKEFDITKLSPENPVYETAKSNLFSLIMNKLTSIRYDFTQDPNARNVLNFVETYIEWIINCYVTSKFSIQNDRMQPSKLLIDNYIIFLNLLKKLEYLLKHKKILKNILALKTKEHLNSDNALSFKDKKLKEIISTIETNKSKPEKLITPFDSLDDLKKFIDLFANEFEEIQIELDNEELKAKFTDDKDVEIILDTENVRIVKILTKTGSLYCGSGTSWCTATTSFFNKYDRYSKLGDLFIILNKKNSKQKYQMHIAEGQLRDDKDKKITITNLLSLFHGDRDLAEFFSELSKNFVTKPKIDLYQFFERQPSTLIFTIRSLYYDYIYSDLEHNNFREVFKRHIAGITYPIKILIFDELFNQEIGDALQHNLRDLEVLKFGASFNQEFGNSLDNLPSLKTLILTKTYNKEFPANLSARNIEIKIES